jgi:hypothetical protein
MLSSPVPARSDDAVGCSRRFLLHMSTECGTGDGLMSGRPRGSGWPPTLDAAGQQRGLAIDGVAGR